MNFKLNALLLAIFAIFTSQIFGEEVTTEEGVYVLGDTTVKSFVEENEFVLVEFYAPWCGHCKALAPEYEKAAAKLAAAGSPVKLAKVDSTVHAEAAAAEGVRGYPTLKWYVNGKSTEYNGGRTEDTIVSWVTKKSGPAAVVVADVAALDALKEKYDVFVIATHIAEGSDELKTVQSHASENMDDVDMFYTNSAEIATALGVSESTYVLLKQFDEKRADLKFTNDVTEVTKFIKGNYLPYVIEFSGETQKKIFGGDIKTHSLLFGDLKADATKELLECYTASAKKFKADGIQSMMVTVDTTKADNKGVLDYFKIGDIDTPKLRVIKLGNDMVKFVPEGDACTCDIFNTFIPGVIDGSIAPHLMSEEIPEDWDKEDVKVLVGKNFEAVALDDKKFAFVEFYAPWCGHCKKLAPIYDQLGAHYKNFADKVVIAKMDSTGNEVKQVSIQGFPTLKGFKAGTNEMVDYTSERDLASMIKFIDEQAGIDSGEPAAPAEDEKKDEL